MKNQEGNALFFILIAIGLLGLLTVMMSRSSNTSNETGDYEQNVIAANEILSYAKNIENAVQGLLAYGCSENDISFWHDSDGNGTENASDVYFNTESDLTDHSCHVFQPEGAGLIWDTPNEKWLDTSLDTEGFYGEYSFHGNCVNGVGNNPDIVGCNTPSTSRTKADLIIALPYINKSICNAINSIINDSSDIPVDAFNYIHNPSIFKGSFEQNNTAINFAPLQNPHSGCLTGDATGQFISSNAFGFYHVLIAR